MIKRLRIYKVYREYSGLEAKSIWISREAIYTNDQGKINEPDHHYEHPTRSSRIRLSALMADLKLAGKTDTNRIDTIHRDSNGTTQEI